MGMGQRTSTLRKAANRLVLAACRSLSVLHPPSLRAVVKQEICSLPDHHEEVVDKSDSCSNTHITSTILCSICLEPLSHCDDSYPGEAMFTGQCSHSFHFSCIASNVRHGSVTCPVCRAHWTHLPCASSPNLSRRQLDNLVFPIRDDSIAAFRVDRYSFIRSARYDDDDPIDPSHSTSYPRMDFSLVPLTVAPNLVSYSCCFKMLHIHEAAYPPLRTGLGTNHNHLTSMSSPSLLPRPEYCQCLCTPLDKRKAYLSVRLTDIQPIDLVLIVSPCGPHLQLLKQAMILVAFSLRPIDRLAIITTYPCVAARVFALRRMTSCGKRAALGVIDRLFYMGQTDPSQGILKGVKVLNDRAYKNPRCSILHICGSLIRSCYPNSVLQMGVMVHRFRVGFGSETWNGFVMHKLEELLEKVLGGVASDIQLRIGIERKVVKVGELRRGEERQVLVDLGVHVNVRIGYSYVVEGDGHECIRRRGETTLSFDDKEGIKTDACEAAGGSMNTTSVRRRISTETWDQHDPFMARRCVSMHETVNL